MTQIRAATMSFLLHSFCPTTIWTQNSITLQVPPHHVSVTGRSQSSVHLEGSDFLSCGLYWILFETMSSRTPQTLTSYKLTLCCPASVFRVQSLFLVCTTRLKHRTSLDSIRWLQPHTRISHNPDFTENWQGTERRGLHLAPQNKLFKKCIYFCYC